MKIIKSYGLYFILFMMCLLLQGCNTDGSLAPSIYFEGITVTDANGNIISDDPDDWQPRNSFNNFVWDVAGISKST